MGCQATTKVVEVDLYVLTWNDDCDLLLSERQVTEGHTHPHTPTLEGSGRTSQVLPMLSCLCGVGFGG